MHSVAHKVRSLNLSAKLSDEIAQLIPGGVNSPFRSFTEVGGHTIFFTKGLGSRLYDIDGNEYVDYLGAWGPAVLGHCHPDVIAACQSILAQGPVFGAPHELELKLAQAMVSAIPSLEQVRFVSSGTEAVMSAIRLARGATGKDDIIMFEGAYHGHSDATLASSKHATSDGITKNNARNTLLVEFNNLQALEDCLKANQHQVAAVIVEPVAGSMNVIAPAPGFLQGLRKLCTEYGVILIFDEVLTGFRLSLGGAQSLFHVQPDLSCFGKAMAGGLSIGAYGGSKRIMSELMPIGKVYQAGTFAGNPVTMAGAIETIRLLSKPDFFPKLNKISEHFLGSLKNVVDRLGVPVQVQNVGSMFGIAFAPKPVNNYTDSLLIDSRAYAKFFHYLLERGIYMPPSSVDAACISAAHTEEEIDLTIAVCEEALKTIY